MKQAPSNLLAQPKIPRILSFLMALVIISGIYSCKSNESAPTLSANDSIAIVKAITKDNFEKIYYLRFPADLQIRIFNSNNDIKQIHFKWHSYADNIWGLDAYGMDETGESALTGPVELEPITTIPPMINIWRDRSEPQVTTRGEIKNILGLASAGQDVVIRDPEFRDLYFSPVEYPYADDSNSTFFIISADRTVLMGNQKTKLAGQQGYTNPSPPAKMACAPCD